MGLRKWILGVIGVSLFLPMFSSAASYFTILDNGWIGVGSSTPLSMLDVAGTIYSRLKTLTDSSSLTVDWNNSNTQAVTLNTGNTTLTFSNAQAGGEYNLLLTQDGTGGRTVTWPSTVRWAGGSPPVLSAVANGIDKAHFVYTGSVFLGDFASSYGRVPDPVAYWKLDESSGDATDAVGGVNTLTNNNSVAYSTGLINNAADFGSSNTNKSLFGSTTLGIGSGPMSYSFWVKVTTAPTSGNKAAIIGLSDDTTDVSYDVLYWNLAGTLTLRFDRRQDGVADHFLDYPVTLTPGTWYYVTATYDGSDMNLYLNGSKVAGPLTTSGTGSDTITTGINIGRSEQPSTFFSGLVDEAGVWNKALSGNDVTSLYNGGSGLQPPF